MGSLWTTQESTKSLGPPHLIQYSARATCRENQQKCKSRRTVTPTPPPPHQHHHALDVSADEKCHNGFNQPRTKCRVHSPPEAFLSLIRGVSSCRPPKPARTQTAASDRPRIITALVSRFLSFPSGLNPVGANVSARPVSSNWNGSDRTVRVNPN